MPKNVQVGDKVIEFPDNMADEAISAVLRKSNPSPNESFKPTVSIGAPTENSATQYFQHVGQDLSSGGTRTGIGRALGHLQGRGDSGYSGLNAGVSEGAGNFMGSPMLGIANALQGASSIPQHPIAGPLKILSGLLQAGTIPGMIMGGPGAAKALEAIPSAANAGNNLNTIASTVGKTAVPLGSESLEALQRLAELSENGGAGSVPPGVMQLINRSQRISPMVYPEARDYVSNISTLSAAEKMASKPQVAAQVGELTSNLHGDIANAIGQYGPNYLDAIKEYARAQQMKQALKTAGKVAAGTGAAAVVGKGTYDLAKRMAGK